MSLDSDWWVRGGRVQALTKLKTSSLAMLGILVLLVMEAFLLPLMSGDWDGVAYFVFPCLSIALIYFLFSLYLTSRFGPNLVGELGFIYIGIALIYTIVPAFNIANGLVEGDPITLLNPTNRMVLEQLWRHTLFVFGFVCGYPLIRGSQPLSNIEPKMNVRMESLAINFLLILLLLSVTYLVLMSAPVETYYDAYSRYEHLSWGLGKIASISIRFKSAIYAIVMTLMFLNYKRYRIALPLFILIICGFELIFSFGARIQVFTILIQYLCLYTLVVKRIPLRDILLISAIFIPLFFLVEVVRLGVGIQGAGAAIDGISFQLPWEFNAVFYTGLHLYIERLGGSMPFVEWPMFFNDFISIFTFNDFLQWNPMEWYYLNFYPNAPVAPYTLGPIADSAIWGGEVDLFFRGIFNGLFFGLIARWFSSYKNRWWALSIYVFCCGASIITLKYSVFYILTPLAKNMLPVILMVVCFMKFISMNRIDLSASGKPTSFL